MGLRIHTNVASIRALRTLGVTDRALSKSLERLSTGLRINRGSDDPSGLVISEQLRAQLGAIDQALSNSQNASNVISIIDAALQEASDLLISIQDSIVFAQNTGGASEDQIAAEQDAVDQAIAAVDRIANTTRYADGALLNGAAEYQQISGLPGEFQNINVRNMEFLGGTTRTLDVTVDINPQRGTLQIAGASAVGVTTLRVTGNRGTQDVIVASGAGGTAMASAINNVAAFTGVWASGGANLHLRSEEFGPEQFVKFEVVQGSVSGGAAGFVTYLDDSTDVGQMVTMSGLTGLGAGDQVADFGLDGQVSFEGQVFTGRGRHFSILAANASFEFEIDPDDVTTDDSTVPVLVNGGNAVGFTVASTGLVFQLNELPRPTDRLSIGIQGVNISRLGFEPFRDRIAEAIGDFSAQVDKGGYLSEVKTGQGSDLFNDPGNAHAIIGRAIGDMTRLRGFLGAVQADTIEPNIVSLGVNIENLSASLSDLRDLDFAEETANYTKTQVLFRSGISVIAAANVMPQSALRLLG
ncbi:MAG: flagellin N-terminal helical domain-containing protein [Planctomycetota bacterium]